METQCVVLAKAWEPTADFQKCLFKPCLSVSEAKINKPNMNNLISGQFNTTL